MTVFYLSIFGFLVCTAVIIYSGSKLAKYGDTIAELTGWGKAWVGLILMASVTSLPELMTGLSAVIFVDAPDLATGDIFGSCVFNLLILSVLDAWIKKPLFSMVKPSHIVAALFGIILLSVSGLAIFLANETFLLLWISPFTLVIFGVYLVSVWGIFKYEHAALLVLETSDAPVKSKPAELKKVISNYALHALVVISAAVFLPYFGSIIALQTGLSDTFFGTLFLAAATSLPELVVSFAALRIGALDMAVGNLLGSNVFNIFILGIIDVFYREGSLYKAASSSHLLSVFTTIIMTALVGLGLLLRPKKKQVWLFSLDTFIIILLYISLMVYLFIKK